MIYCMSDIHADYDRYAAMLSKIHLVGRDTLYVLGNIIDGKGDGMKLLLDMMMRENVFPVIGEHEYAALRCLKHMTGGVTMDSVANMDDRLKRRISDWAALGGQSTIAQFLALDEDKREMIVDYLSDFALYEEVSVSGKDYVLVHAGLGNFAPDKGLDDYDIRELIMNPADYSKQYFSDKTLVTGHTPTREIYHEQNPLTEPAPKGEASPYDKVYINNNHIAINCGANIGGRLAAVRLDDRKAFYID